MESNITAKSAIECLKKHKEERRNDFIVLMGAVGIAIEALKKQIPKKPILDKEQTMRYVTTYTCPACGKGLTGTKVCSYCYHCGQALDWSNE